MLRWREILLATVLACIPLSSFAQTLIKHGESGNIAIVPLTSCAAPVGQRTFEMPERTAKGYGLALFHIKMTAATDMSLQCSSSINRDFLPPNQETHGKLQVCDNVTAGACKLIDAKFIKTTLAAEELIARVDLLGSEDIQCVFSCTSGSFQIWTRMSAL